MLTDLNNAIVWMVTTRPFISKSFTPCTKPLVTVPSAPTSIIFTVIVTFHIFFSSLARSMYLSLFSISFSFFFSFGQLERQSPLFCRFFFFLLTFTRFGCLAEIRWSVCILKSTDSGLYILLLFTLFKFFTSILADGFSLELEWPQVSSSLQDSSQYSGRSQ